MHLINLVEFVTMDILLIVMENVLKLQLQIVFEWIVNQIV